ncbi:MAG: phosphoribosylanthranilate isomerase [Nevskia sp.]
MHRTRIKFCGITRAEDAAGAIALGIDALGFILVPQSPRCLSLARAAELIAGLPPLLSSVVLLRNPDAAAVDEVLRTLKPSLLQFHGEESAAFCASFGWPYLKAVAMQGESRSLAAIADEYASAAGLLLDGHAAGGLGGQGRAFDWSRATENLRLPLLLAGGLGPDNVAAAIAAARPYAVDVSSGIEAAPGLKDSGKMLAFVRAARLADARADNDSQN